MVALSDTDKEAETFCAACLRSSNKMSSEGKAKLIRAVRIHSSVPPQVGRMKAQNNRQGHASASMEEKEKIEVEADVEKADLKIKFSSKSQSSLVIRSKMRVGRDLKWPSCL